MSETRIRIPRMHGLPPHCRRLHVMRVLQSDIAVNALIHDVTRQCDATMGVWLPCAPCRQALPKPTRSSEVHCVSDRGASMSPVMNDAPLSRITIDAEI